MCCGCPFSCNGDTYNDTFASLDGGWTVEATNHSAAVVSGRLEISRDSGGAEETRVERSFSSGTPTTVVIKVDVFEVTDGEAAGIGWDPSGTAGRWDWELFASWTLNRFTITHNGTLVNINMSPGSQHTLAMEITDIGGGQVQ